MAELGVFVLYVQEGERKVVALEREGLAKERHQLSLAQKQCRATQQDADRSKAQVSYTASLAMSHLLCTLLIM